MAKNPRLAYSRAFVTEFPDEGLIVPWNPLPVGEYLKYQRDIDRGLHSNAVLENEIFSRCVLDQSLVRRIDYLKAGVVSVVVGNILQASGDVTATQLAEDLESARYLNDQFAIVHELANLVLDAFPYKPEEVYGMDYSLLLERAAQAERKLLRLGVLKEPISIQQKDGEAIQPPQQDQRRRVVEHKQQKVVVPQEQLLTTAQKRKGKWWKISPVLESKEAKTINTRVEQAEQVVNLTGHETIDLGVKQILLQKRAQVIYKDLIEHFYKSGENKNKK